MFPKLREAKPDNETAAGMLARAVRHDLSSMARVQAVTGTIGPMAGAREGELQAAVRVRGHVHHVPGRRRRGSQGAPMGGQKQGGGLSFLICGDSVL